MTCSDTSSQLTPLRYVGDSPTVENFHWNPPDDFVNLSPSLDISDSMETRWRQTGPVFVWPDAVCSNAWMALRASDDLHVETERSHAVTVKGNSKNTNSLRLFPNTSDDGERFLFWVISQHSGMCRTSENRLKLLLIHLWDFTGWMTWWVSV